MGYEVRLQQVPNGDGAEGSNVIAVKPAQSDADILILSAHHDSVPTSFGANDNASGVAALARRRAGACAVPSDTELRVISFTGEEDGKVGSRYYVQSLSQQERERIIGDIQFDMLGGLGGLQAQLYTVDGESNWLVDCLLAQDDSLSLGAEAASDHTSFQMAGIPSVLVMQKNRGYLYHSVADVAGQVDCEAIAAAVAPRRGRRFGYSHVGCIFAARASASRGRRLCAAPEQAKRDLFRSIPRGDGGVFGSGRNAGGKQPRARGRLDGPL